MDFFEEHSETDKGTITQWDGVKTIKMWYTKEKKIEILNYNLFLVWKKKREPIEDQSEREPIEDQSDGCINFIYSLISKNGYFFHSYWFLFVFCYNYLNNL